MKPSVFLPLAVAALAAWAGVARAEAPAHAAATERGRGLVVATEDTLPFIAGTLDTLLVDAPRLSVSEIVRLVGERLAADEVRMGDHAWTQVTRVVARKHAGRDGDRTEFELVERFQTQRAGAYQRVRLRQVERKFEGGRLVKEKQEDEVEGDYEQVADATSAIPFSLEGADEYNYEVLARDLLGGHLIYKIGFTPKSRFKALPAGTVWIDCSDFVIRRLEAAMTEGAPLPVFIKSIPWFKIRRVQRGGFWVVDDVMAKIELRRVLPSVPAEVELYMRTSDHLINGLACPDTGPAGREATR